MSTSDARLNLIITLIIMTPLSLLSWWIIHKTPLNGLAGAEKWRAYRIRIGAAAIILLNIALILYFAAQSITIA